MERNKIICSLILFLLIFIPLGCSSFRNPADDDDSSGLSKMMQNDSVAKRFQESSSRNPTVVESAIELSEKYAKLSDEAAQLRRQNEDLGAQNKLFREQLDTLEKRLQQTQKELGEANEVLIEMRVELNNWKTDVLGFRDEMRDAESAQLEALLKILHVLGGELKTESAQGGTIGSAGSAVANLGNSG